eukprot:2333130-Alexandrium_andersonii.AAC.1
MSASLVGSGDVYKRQEKTPAAPRWTDEERTEWRKQLDQRWNDCEKSVSYTHLTLPTICSV